MKRLVKSEKFIYIVIAAAFIGAFFAVYLKIQQKTELSKNAVPVVIHDVRQGKNKEEKRTVYITPSGKKYHLDGCDYLGEKKMAVSEKDAVNAGYEACAYCQP